MIIPKFRPTTRQNVPKADPWIDEFMDPVHDQLKRLTTATERRLSAKDNLNSEIREFQVKHDTWVDLNLKTLNGKPRDVLLTAWDLDDYAKMQWKLVDLDTIKVKVYFDTTPTTDVLIRILVLGD